MKEHLIVVSIFICLVIIFTYPVLTYVERRSHKEFETCINDQVELYGDLCAESSSGYEDMTGHDAHYEGVKCAVESIKACIEGELK